VSWTWKSIGGEASRIPVSPPSRKVARNPTANSIGVSKVSLPFHIVPIQFTNLIPVGMAMRNVVSEKNGRSTAPVANMWCAHTAAERIVMATLAKIMPL
jgi:hypothetical protein